MKKRWMICALLLIVAVTLLTTVAFAAISGTGGNPYANTVWIETVYLGEDDKSGDGWDWDASGQTLTLENANIGCKDGSLFESGRDRDYKVVLKGINCLASLHGSALFCDGDLTVTGDGLMQIDAKEGFSVIYADNITIRDTTVRIFGHVSDGIWADEDLEVENSELYIDTSTWAGIVGDAVTISDSEIRIRWTEDSGVSAREGLMISDSEITITRSDYCGVHVDKGDLTLRDSVLRVEASQYGVSVYKGDNVIVEDSEVYLYGSKNAFSSANDKLNFESDAPIRGARFKSQELTETELCRTGRVCVFLVGGKIARVLQIKPSSSAFALIAAIESAQNAQIPFSDVTEQTQYCDAIAEAYSRGMMGGVSATQFAPNDTLTRAMVWTVLARANGINTEIGATWDSAGRDWAMREKVSDGTNPNGAVTVEELVTMAWRNVGSPYRVADLGNTDVSDWAVEAMRWAYETGILSRQINPKNNATRALTAHVLTAQ